MGGQALPAYLNHGTSGIALDVFGNLYISDGGNYRIRNVNTAGIISTIVGTGIAGFSGDGAQATAVKVNGIGVITCDAAGNLYVVDYNNNRIRKNKYVGIINTIAGNGTAGYSGDGGRLPMQK